MQSSASCTSLALKLTAGTHVAAGVPNAASRIEGGTPTFRHVTLALTAAGFSTFTVLYCVQPFLPVLKDTCEYILGCNNISSSYCQPLPAAPARAGHRGTDPRRPPCAPAGT